jgi:subtilase family serine protease
MKAAALVLGSLVAHGAWSQELQNGSTGTGGEIATSPPTPQVGHVYVPESSKSQPPGLVHTNYVVWSKDGNKPVGVLSSAVESTTPGPDSTVEVEGETPCSLGYLYVQSPSTFCAPSFSTPGSPPSAAGAGVIMLVDAYDNPDAASDIAAFSTKFGLPAPNFSKIYANKAANSGASCSGVPPSGVGTGWPTEASLDIEWAHVFASSATIVLVEACSASTSDLVAAEQVAFSTMVKSHPVGGQISNSWGGPESSGQLADDEYFADWHYNASNHFSPPILAFASAGDSGAGAQWPSTNPWVISAGGTSVYRNASTLAFSSEGCWSGSGGGQSAYETYATTFSAGSYMGAWANFQYPIFGQAARSTPDLSFDADPNSGVWVYAYAEYGGWIVLGGTSVASPSLASIVNRAGNHLGSVHLNAVIGGNGDFSTEENNLLYSQLAAVKAYAANFYDVTTGSNGYSAVAGYDLCTGVGTPRGLLGK